MQYTATHNGEQIPRYGWDSPHTSPTGNPNDSFRVPAGSHLILSGDLTCRDILIENRIRIQKRENN